MKIIAGDVFEILLSENRKTYGQYLARTEMGPLIQIFNVNTAENMGVNQIVELQLMFPPVLVGLFAAVKDKMWKIIGNRPVVNFTHPLFVLTLYDQKTGDARTWFVWNGEKVIQVGKVLPNEYKKLEFLVVWSPSRLVERIEKQKMPFPYYELIQYNKFSPVDTHT